MQKTKLILLALFVALLASGCADPNLAEDNLAFCQRQLSGIFWGLWHGFIAPFSLIGSLFNGDIAVYDICNVGGWYDFGFCLGIGAFTKGTDSAGTAATRSDNKRERDSSFTDWWGGSDD